MSKTRLLPFIAALALFLPHAAAQVELPTFEMWVECVNRGPYEGRADAELSYRYDGAFAIMAEDSRYYGDIGTDYIQLAPFAIEPGEHKRFMTIHVGAFKAVLWKVVFLDELHVIAVWDDPAIPDCPWQAEPTATPQLSDQT